MSELSTDVLAPILSGGGVLAFAFIVYRAIEKLADRMDKRFEELADEMREDRKLLTRAVERLARIDTRTYRAFGGGLGPGAATPPLGIRHRTKPATPFVDDKRSDDDEEDDHG